MRDYTKIATRKFTAHLVEEGSWGARKLGKHSSTMDLYFRTDDTGFIEWDIPALYTCEEIGLVFELDAAGARTLCDYDGVMSLPVEAVDLLRANGVAVPPEFDDRQGVMQ